MSLRIATVAVSAMLAMPAGAGPLATKAGEFRPATPAPAVAKAETPARMRLDAARPTRRVELARPDAAESRKLIALNGGSAIAAPGRPQFIGYGRDVPAPVRRVDLATLAWTTLPDGAKAARIEVDSPGAAGMRVALRLSGVDPAATLRFAASGATESRRSIRADAVAQAAAQFGEYWSPVIDGERVAIENEVPESAKLAGAILEVVRLSHLVVRPSASRTAEAKLLSDIGDSGSCNIDFQCAPAYQDQVAYNAADATGKLVFTADSGGTARCTGTMLNDTVGSGTPYLFSASHCFESAYEAASLEVWWFFDSKSCDSLAPGAYQVQYGGARLLARSRDWDWALLGLNGAPPGGVVFSAWDSATVQPSIEVEIFHHPSGDLKKWSSGTSFVQVPVDFGSAAGGSGYFTRVVWDYGTTEGGSSGGALRVFNGKSLEVRGGLLGGSAQCSNPGGSDYFSQLGQMIPLVRAYLTPDTVPAEYVPVVEYYHPALDHYFMTASPVEIAILDGGNPPGWQRTGFRFLAYAGPGAGRSPVCRYYQQSNNSHFYSADPAQCALVSTLFPDWTFESANVFYMGLPDAASGACAAGTHPVYRFYHPSVVNHRFPAEQTVANDLSATWGWVPEGYGPGPLYPAMCSPNGV